MYTFDLQSVLQSADCSADCSANSDQTCTFQCIIPIDDHSKIRAPSGYGRLGEMSDFPTVESQINCREMLVSLF